MNIQHGFYYAAYSYLDEWMAQDRQFHQILAFEQSNETTLEAGTKTLVGMATYYGVIRTFKDNGEQPRLRAAYEALLATNAPTESTRVERVTALAEVFRAKYGAFAISAASKFLWMRFRSPIIIYDSVASGWLCANCGYKNDGYGAYCEVWSAKYAECQEEVKEACAALTNIQKFTRARGISNAEISSWTSSEWFG